ncbi:hypothetical protein D3Z39_00670 [Anaerotruncus colihominis]|uniref:Uncharacterized protein n=1 Tax=Anaerotruncus colihominis TaxID=169435 RepID=A0A845RCU6_9FIRM|nr:hypothetical protein [Anaerotruncus colihominis]
MDGQFFIDCKTQSIKNSCWTVIFYHAPVVRLDRLPKEFIGFVLSLTLGRRFYMNCKTIHVKRFDAPFIYYCRLLFSDSKRPAPVGAGLFKTDVLFKKLEIQYLKFQIIFWYGEFQDISIFCINNQREVPRINRSIDNQTPFLLTYRDTVVIQRRIQSGQYHF